MICRSISSMWLFRMSRPGFSGSSAGRGCSSPAGFSDLRRDELHRQDRFFRHQDHPFDEVLQFPDIPGPGIGEEAIPDLGCDPFDPAREFPVEFFDEIVGQGGDVLGPLPQRRDVDGKDVQAVEEILPELSLLHRLQEVPVRGRDEAHVHRDGLESAHPLEALVLDRLEELCLHLPRDLADLVQKERSLVRQLESPRLRRDGAGEGPFLVAEEFAFDEILRDGGAVDLDEGLLFPGALPVDGAGDQLLARPRLPGDEHGGRRGRYLADDLVDLGHAAAGARRCGTGPPRRSPPRGRCR